MSDILLSNWLLSNQHLYQPTSLWVLLSFWYICHRSWPSGMESLWYFLILIEFTIPRFFCLMRQLQLWILRVNQQWRQHWPGQLWSVLKCSCQCPWSSINDVMGRTEQQQAPQTSFSPFSTTGLNVCWDLNIHKQFWGSLWFVLL